MPVIAQRHALYIQDHSGSEPVGSYKLVSYSRRAKGELKDHILPVPAGCPALTHQIVSSSAPRRSRRLAALANKKATADQHMQFLLAKRLGLIQGNGLENHSGPNTFASLFDAQLLRDHIIALAVLFKIPVSDKLPPGVEGQAEAMVAHEPVLAA